VRIRMLDGAEVAKLYNSRYCIVAFLQVKIKI
jgi:hypothetical protein